MNKIEETSGAKQILKKIRENYGGIHISRVPEKTKKQFIELANDEFCGDYGMTLKFIMTGLVNADTQMILDNIDNLNERVSNLEESYKTGTETPAKSIKMMNGKELNKK